MLVCTVEVKLGRDLRREISARTVTRSVSTSQTNIEICKDKRRYIYIDPNNILAMEIREAFSNI
jgi:hypothetical protein